jgi:hypothetical protein
MQFSPFTFRLQHRPPKSVLPGCEITIPGGISITDSLIWKSMTRWSWIGYKTEFDKGNLPGLTSETELGFTSIFHVVACNLQTVTALQCQWRAKRTLGSEYRAAYVPDSEHVPNPSCGINVPQVFWCINKSRESNGAYPDPVRWHVPSLGLSVPIGRYNFLFWQL